VKNLTGWVLGIGGGFALALSVVACGSAEDGSEEVASTQESLELADVVTEVPTDYVVAPGGRLFHKDCVHTLPDGATADEDDNVIVNGKVVAHYNKCAHKVFRFGPKRDGQPPAPGGWVASTEATSSETTFTYMSSGEWQVPANPVGNHGQLLYFFPSFQTSGASGSANLVIVQPVLQWGVSPAGGGRYWAMASWVVNAAGSAWHSTLKRVNAGEWIIGEMTLLAKTASAQRWQIYWLNESTGISQTFSKSFSVNKPFNRAEGAVLEAYSVSNCSDFPSGSTGNTYFSAPTLFQGTAASDRHAASPFWTTSVPGYTGLNCNFNATVSNGGGSSGSATLFY
jgi:hypothetical protein